MSTQKYYQDELSYLRDLGDEFSRENPTLAPFISRQSNDPDVERLLEGFAFLTARLRQKLDDQLPELSHSLIQVLWPHYLRPIPACSIVEFKTSGPQAILPEGTAVQSRPVDGTRCTFRTCFETDVRPLRITDVRVETGATTSMLHLRIANTAGQSGDRLTPGTLRIHLSAEREPLVSRNIYQWMRTHLDQITVVAGGFTATLPADALQPVGFSADRKLLPYPPTAFDGFRHLQEYFAFPEKFMFVDVTGLAVLKEATTAEFDLTFQFDRPLPERFRPGINHFRLNCAPVINLFPANAQPLTVDHRRTEYRLRPEAGNVDHYGIFSVDRVTGWTRARNAMTVYEPFESFQHVSETQAGSFYRARLRPPVVRGLTETYLSFINANGTTLLPPNETVAVELTCTNARLAEHVPIGGIDQVTAAVPAHVSFRNIGAVTPEIPPPIEGDLLWRLISNLARNYGSLAELGSLRAVIGTHNIAATVDQQARRRLDLTLEGIRETVVAPFDWIVRGIPVRGERIHLRVAESRLGGEAEAYLFGCVLDAFFGAYAGINSVHQLALTGEEAHVEFEWPVRFGTRQAI